MPTALTRDFGKIDYANGDQFFFPQGLPGFPEERVFLPVEIPEQFPLLYLQSVRTPDLCFVALPVNSIVAGYEFRANAGDVVDIGLTPGAQPGPDMLCLALVCFGEDGPAANLRAPVVINVKNRMGAQIIQNEDRYPIRFPLGPAREVTTCS
jgi:flagellar assembly factor FliW